MRGITIALILGFAVVTIYFYSTSIVNVGLGELFVAIKGAMIVLGTFYVQSATIEPAALYIGAIVGILSATVLFVNSFPDFEADRSNSRHTLVIILGKKKAADAFVFFLIAAYAMIVAGIFLGFTKAYSLISFASIPFAIRSVMSLKKDHESLERLVAAMASAVTYSRITGFLLALSLLF
jgi:1,4-dihydroxy-2-naphthoate polyprenyltransferase